MSETPKVKNFINGQFVESEAKEFIPIISPSDSSTLALVPLSPVSELEAAVQFGLKAFESWSNLTIKQRASVMFKFHSLVESHSQELAEIIVKENGKNITEALADVAKGNEVFDYYNCDCYCCYYLI